MHNIVHNNVISMVISILIFSDMNDNLCSASYFIIEVQEMSSWKIRNQRCKIGYEDVGRFGELSGRCGWGP